jgi:gliding motility-associated-like protein
MVTDVFAGNPEVFWGFTGSTGGSRNRQRFCTSLNPGIAALTSGTVTCYPTPIQFKDSSVSFGDIVKWYWNFGDGTTDTVRTPAPHIFPAPGIYNVKMNILGNNGCISDTFQRQVIVGSEPIAKFGYSPSLICENALVTFIDSSAVQFGSIDRWTWGLTGQSTNNNTGPEYTHQFDETGQFRMDLAVHSKEGCESVPVSKELNVFPVPEIDMTVMDACFRETVNFAATNIDPSVNISKWEWDLGDGNVAATAAVQHIYTAGGIYNIKLIAVSSGGCKSDTISKPVHIFATNAHAGTDTIVATNQPVQLNASGGIFYNWSPTTGLSNPDIANPVAVFQNNMRYIVTAYTPLGCATSDTIFIKAVKGPAIYVPNAFTPNGDGKNDRFRFIPVGMKEVNYFRVFNRYGQLVYSSNNTQPGWDGKLNGKLQPAGTYVWMVSGRDYNDIIQTQRGTVVLVR